MGLRERKLRERNLARAQEMRACQFLKYAVDPATGCWLYTGTVGSDGYGRVKRYGKTIRAHRAFYEHFVGLIPKGLLVCHVCDRPLCVNPLHLFCGTQLENEQDKDRKGRRPLSWFVLHPELRKRGADNASAKLTEDQVAEIRGCRDVARLARKFGVHCTTIQ